MAEFKSVRSVVLPACRPQMLIDKSSEAHKPLRQEFVAYTGKSTGVKMGFVEFCEKHESLIELGHLEPEKKGFPHWLKSMAQDGQFADHFVIKLLQEMSQVQLLVYTLDNDTGCAKNNPVEIAKRESSALCLLLDNQHFYPMVLRPCLENIPVQLRPTPAGWMKTPDGQEFGIFGVHGDGNCLFRALAFFEKHLSFKLNHFNSLFRFDGVDENAMPNVLGTTLTFVQESMTLLEPDGRDKVKWQFGDILSSSPGLKSQTKGTPTTCYMGHALEDGVRYLILFTGSLSLKRVVQECALMEATAPAAPHDWIECMMTATKKTFGTLLKDNTVLVEDDVEPCSVSGSDVADQKWLDCIAELEKTLHSSQQATELAQNAALKAQTENTTLTAAADSATKDFDSKLAQALNDYQNGLDPCKITPTRRSMRLQNDNVGELQMDCKQKDEQLAELRSEVTALKTELDSPNRQPGFVEHAVNMITVQDHQQILESWKATTERATNKLARDTDIQSQKQARALVNSTTKHDKAVNDLNSQKELYKKIQELYAEGKADWKKATGETTRQMTNLTTETNKQMNKLTAENSKLNISLGKLEYVESALGAALSLNKVQAEDVAQGRVTVAGCQADLAEEVRKHKITSDQLSTVEDQCVVSTDERIQELRDQNTATDVMLQREKTAATEAQIAAGILLEDQKTKADAWLLEHTTQWDLTLQLQKKQADATLHEQKVQADAALQKQEEAANATLQKQEEAANATLQKQKEAANDTLQEHKTATTGEQMSLKSEIEKLQKKITDCKRKQKSKMDTRLADMTGSHAKTLRELQEKHAIEKTELDEKLRSKKRKYDKSKHDHSQNTAAQKQNDDIRELRDAVNRKDQMPDYLREIVSNSLSQSRPKPQSFWQHQPTEWNSENFNPNLESQQKARSTKPVALTLWTSEMVMREYKILGLDHFMQSFQLAGLHLGSGLSEVSSHTELFELGISDKDLRLSSIQCRALFSAIQRWKS